MKHKKAKNIHFMGIGGSGVSSLAGILREQGHHISGCDQTASPFTEKLEKEGVDISIGHSPSHLHQTDLLVYTSAIKDDAQEREAATNNNIEQQSYPQALGQLTKEIPTIAICGTHGKTTTTAFTYFAFTHANTNPALVVGSTIPQLNNINGTLGDGKLLIIEACEYKRHFLEYHPQTIVITNLELDHLDYYKNQQDYSQAFYQFAMKLPETGTLIANGDDQNIQQLISELKQQNTKFNIITFGTNKNNDYHVSNNVVYQNNKQITELNVQLPGKHNLMNALAAFVTAQVHQLPAAKSTHGISQFKGTGRRMELIGEYKGALIYDDYAHHPSEIKATLQAVREKYGTEKKVLSIFQPHQHSRTLNLQDEFATSFTDTDQLIIADIYEARDSDQSSQSITSQQLAEKTSAKHPSTSYGGSIDQILTNIRTQENLPDIIISLGAGDIWELSHQLADL